MDDKFALGQSPIQLSEPVWIWTRHRLSFSKPGYKTRVIEIENTGINPGGALVCVCTAGILLPLFFRSAYLPQYSVELAPEEQATAPIQLQQRFSFQESFHAPNYR